MASRVFWGLFGLIFLPAAVTSQADQSPPVETISIKSKKVVVDPADIVLGGTTVSAGGPAVTIGGDVVFEDRHEDLFANGVEVLTGSPDIARTKFRSSSKLGSQNSSISATTGSSHATATSPSSSLFHPTSSNLSVPGSLTELPQNNPGGRTASSAFSWAGSSITTSSKGTTIASSETRSAIVYKTIGNLTVSASVARNSSGRVKAPSISTSSTMTQNPGTSSGFFESSSSSFGLSTSNLKAEVTANIEISRGSASTWLSPKLSSLLSSPSSVAKSSSTASQKMRSDTLLSTPRLNLAEVSTSTNQTFVSSTSASSRKLTVATTHSNNTSLGAQTSSSVLKFSSSSSDRISIASSNAFLAPSSSSASVANQWNKAYSTLFSGSTNIETNTLTANAQIVIPTASLSPTNATAIAGGVAIGEGMALLYSKAHANSDESAALVASKTIFINSIETLKADLERLRTDLGGSGTSCSRSKFRNRHRKRSIFSDLLSTINNAVCSLTKIQADIETVPPDLDEIEADWVEIDGLADELTEEEEEEEKGEEEEEETQSAEEEKASKTSSMRSSSTSVSSVSAYFFSDMIEPYPAEYYEPAAAENAVFAAAGAALFAAMGGSGGGTAGISDSSTSIISSSVPRASAETSTNLPSRITDGYWLNGVWIPGGSGKNGITSSTVNATTSTLNRFATLALNSPSVTTTLKKATAPNIPDKANTVNALSEFLQTVHFAQVSTSGITPLAASISEASASRVSAEKASAAAASAAAVSASKASALAASAAAASAAAAAASFPSQISSNQGSSSLCKSIGHASCIFAYSLYNPLYFYTEYTSYIYTTGGFDGEWLGWGCAAMFKCYTSEDYAKGMGGQEILNAFEYLYAEDGVEICGTIYMDNGCYLTVNACASCKSSIPCEALPEKDQPPDGGVPCYYTNGTTWPSTSDSSGSDCWKCE